MTTDFRDQDQAEQLVAFFQGLADVTRLKLIGLLAQRERSVDELVAGLDVRQPTVSHHLAKLKLLGLVKLRKEGQVHYYSLDEEHVHRLAKSVLSVDGLARLAPADEGATWEQKVLQTFFGSDGRLKEIPAQRKKRDVILRTLVEEFERGRRYHESEMNEVLRRFHEDVATLRREFIMTRMMQRENNLYWRAEAGGDEAPGVDWRMNP
ncbi:MAG: ArsR family transcriptional regulator [Symbiobacteriaceae bacterium]|jgi:DNA-binding transcriptional ArsR family regulator|nr:ArsR family transcriptional regulator [Symbiobacteriaceae bacterium]